MEYWISYQSSNAIADQIDDEIGPLLVDDKNIDKDYEQGDEVDNETTMNEEEALPELEDLTMEIRFLEEESNMPIHELMLMYSYANSAAASDKDERKKKKKKSSSKENKDERKKLSSLSDEILDSTEGENSAKQNTSNESVSGTRPVSADQCGKSKNRKVYAELPQNADFRKFRETYGPHDRPTEHIIVKFETQFSLLDNTRPNRPYPTRSEENIVAVAGSVRDDRDESIRCRSQQLGLSYATTWRILRKDLGLKAYKIQLVRELKPADLPNHSLHCSLENATPEALTNLLPITLNRQTFWNHGYYY
ncbi:Hypothetical protein CINCED_3A017737 [Cinara cedri]|uniref:Uncharacterized protein n=1 Tax=Cinara cedri TaxID=506608 RepID=A0A5E4MDW0_9HEMI|nr:Hypothetical protein CINCED_3A017737 [Cinara cedri]